MMQRHFRILSRTFAQIGIVTVTGFVLCAPVSGLHAQEDISLESSPGLDLPLGDLNEDAIQPLLPDTEVPDAVLSVSEIEEPLPTPQDTELALPTLESNVVPDIPAAVENEEFDENLFFDAEALVPNTELSRKGAPSNVSPVLSPGSRLVITRKQHNAVSKQARLVAAERALTLGRFESALQMYSDLYASNNRDPNILMGRSVALQRLGRNEEAIRSYEQLLDIRPKNIEAQVNLHGLLARRYPAVALRNLIELYEDNPGSISVVAQLAVVEAQLGHYGEAIRYLGIAASTEPENAGHVFNMAVIADRAGDKKQAVQFYEEALEIDTLHGTGKTIPRETIFQRLAELR